GRRPFPGATKMDVVEAVLHREAERLEGVPERLAEIVERALKKRAQERYQTAGEMAAALERLSARFVTGEARADAYVTTAEGRGRKVTDEGTEAPIGRERELSAIVSELRRERLVTVTGPG